MRTLALLALLVGLLGCQRGEPEPTKEDFAKKPMPEGWHGPQNTAPQNK